VRQHLVAVLEFNPEHCVGERFENRAFEHDGVVFWLGQSGPLSNGDRCCRDLLRTREADLGRGAMLSPEELNAKRRLWKIAASVWKMTRVTRL
jgi:hypothetical protein